ncbi:heterokaryon incompatibility protein-domain-containing protein, partial [Immersiella caudata]
TPLDFDRVKTWMRFCDEGHSLCNLERPAAIPGLPVLRLIDVVFNNLVEVTDVPSYFALSYVWGSVPNFRLTTANKPRLLKPGAFYEAWELLPLTIRDAITLTKGLGGRYLWIDSLCLLQNYEDDLSQGVNVMDHIFEQSQLTIVGACGHNANAGLVGLLGSDRKEEQLVTEVRPGLYMGAYYSLDSYLRHSVYETRAWTFQEHLLCRKVLYFVADRVFFRCRRSEWSEICDDKPDLPIPTYQILESAMHSQQPRKRMQLSWPLSDYASILPEYTKRALTADNDALRALAGIMRRVSDKLQCPMLGGLPTRALDQFLLFFGKNLRRRPGFPSYSWAGWHGEVRIEMEPEYNLDKWLASGHWIVWYQRDVNGTETAVWGGDDKLAGFDHRPPFSSEAVVLPSAERIPKSGRWGNFINPRPYPVLRFWSASVWFKLHDMDALAGTGQLQNNKGHACGSVALDGAEDTTLFDSGDPVELVLLSEANYIKPRIRDVSFGFWAARGFYHVMIVEWKDGIAERRGLGTVQRNEIGNGFPPGPVWKEFTLG